MGYPVIAQIGNLPVDIRNGKGLGGGELVGWLPIVSFLALQVLNQLANALRLLRFQKMSQKRAKKAMLIISELSGMNHLRSSWNQLPTVHLLEIGQTVVIEYPGNSFQQLLFYLQTMMSSMWLFYSLKSFNKKSRCIMGNICGVGSLEPCPICHVPKDKLHDCGKAQWPLRTGIETQRIIEQARKLRSGDAEELLKKNGLRPIDVCTNIMKDFFWILLTVD